MSFRIMAIDYGSKRIGIALSDIMQIIASPFLTLESLSLKENVKQILKLAEENNVGEIVVGMPFNMDGSESEMSIMVREFIENLKVSSEIAIIEIDERLTTSQTDRMLIEEGDVSRTRRNKVRDKIAASLILGVYLEQKSIL